MRFFTCFAFVALAQASVLFEENFDNGNKFEATSDKSKTYGDMKITSGKWKGDNGLQSTEDARFYALTRKIDTPFSNEGKDLVVQVSVTHEQNIDCGGGYLKVLPAVDGAFTGDSTYQLMFGPDICGMTKKVHFIFGYKGKNLLWKKEPRCESDQFTHFYTAVIKSDNTYEMYIDNVKKESGNLEDDWDFLPPKEIPDPDDKKPSDWVDEAQIADPEDKKPEGYDDIPETIVDPEAEKPEDWDEDEDGEWEAPTIPNPEYKGEWKPKMIPNPDYKGEWKQKQIANPEYSPDDSLYKFEGQAENVAVDWWQVKAGTIIDNILITDSLSEAQAAFEAYKPKIDAEKAAKKAEDDAKAAEEAAARAEEEEDAEEDEEDRDEL